MIFPKSASAPLSAEKTRVLEALVAAPIVNAFPLLEIVETPAMLTLSKLV